MASSFSPKNTSKCETTLLTSDVLDSARARPISRENKLLYRTHSGRVDNSSSPQSTNRKRTLPRSHSSKISSVNTASCMDTSDDTDEDINGSTSTSLPMNSSGALILKD